MSQKIIFITGATGYVGSYFVYHLLQNTSAIIYCLVRPTARESVQERIYKKLINIHRYYLSAGISIINLENKIKRRIIVIEGDVRQQNLGIKVDLKQIEIDELWHIAANINFSERQKQDVFETNVTGGINVLSFIEVMRIPVVNFISTAYVAGKARGKIAEVLTSENSDVNNTYEESKRIIEKEIIARHERGKISFRIFRPAIIVGHSITHQPDPSNGGLYGFLSLCSSLKNQMQVTAPSYFQQEVLQIVAEKDATLSLINIDHVVDWMFQIGSDPLSLNQIFHLSPDNDICVQLLASVVSDVFDIRMRIAEDKKNFTPIDQLLSRQTQPFNCYLFYKKWFDNSNAQSFSTIPSSKYRIDSQKLKLLVRAFYEKRSSHIMQMESSPM